MFGLLLPFLLPIVFLLLLSFVCAIILMPLILFAAPLSLLPGVFRKDFAAIFSAMAALSAYVLRKV